MSLTDSAIKALKPKHKRYTVSDERGLLLEIFPTSGMAWRFRYRLNGRVEKVTLGKYPALTLKAARQKRDELASLVANGKSPASEKQRAKIAVAEGTTVDEFGAKYMKEVVRKDRKDVRKIARYLDREISPIIGSKAVRDVTTEHVRAIIWSKKAHGRDAAAGDIRGLLKRLFDYAITCGLTGVNPTSALPMRHVFKAKSRQRALSPAELRVFLKAVSTSNLRRQFKLAFYLLLLTMSRKCELLFSRWRDIHFDEAEWHIPAENSKTGKPHIVFLSRQALETFRELSALAGGSEWVMPGRSSIKAPFCSTALNAALKSILEGLEVPAFTIHDFRRTASTLLHEQGWPSDVVEKSLNHTIGGVRGVYNRAEYADQRQKMLQHWGDFLESLLCQNNVVLGRFDRAA